MRASRSFNLPLLALALSCAAACAGSPPPAPATPPAQESAAGEAIAPAPAAKPAPDDETWAGEKADKSEPNANGTASEKATVPAGADSKGTETRTMEVIQKLVLDNRKAARKCYEDARRDLKDLQGNVVIHFVLDPEGKVKLAELNQERSTLKSPVVVNCVIDVFKRIPFPKSSRGMETSGNYPFNFTP